MLESLSLSFNGYFPRERGLAKPTSIFYRPDALPVAQRTESKH